MTQFVKGWLSKQSEFTFHSSGSTGVPKPIIVNRRQIEASVQATARHLQLQPQDRVLLCLNPQYIASLMMVARALILDLDLLLTRPSSNPLLQLDSSVDFASFVPYQIYQMIADDSLVQLSKIRTVLIGGAPLSRAAFEQLASLPNRLYLTYGMTETVSHIALMPIHGHYEEALYHVLESITIGTNAQHCLHIQGVVTNDTRIQTTDVVKLHSDRSFEWLGRADHVINSGGIKIHPEQLEKTIAPWLGDTAFFIAGVEDPVLNERCILVTESPISTDTFVQIQNQITRIYSKHHVPKEVKVSGPFVKTDSGKVKRKEIVQEIA
ncbi:hypothetical protein BFP72_10685 [Reichenbachiella sp. 5M10]|nr:hypothetical protein BFP72_10685 [Reichenbachiella sp. 5M10]